MDVRLRYWSGRVFDALPLIQNYCLGGAVIDPVEQKLIRAVRLGAEQDLGSKEKELSFSDRHFDNRSGLVEVFLTPSPAAAKRGRRVVPCHNPHVLTRRIDTEGRAIVEEQIRPIRHPIGQWISVVDRRL